MKSLSVLALILCWAAGSSVVSAQEFSIDMEASVAAPLYNDVAVPNDATRFSIIDGWTTSPVFSPRIRINAILGNRHEISTLAALLRSSSEGLTGGPVSFAGENFDGNRTLEAFYRFDSYRLAYRYRFVDRERFTFSLGAAGKIRSAAIEIRQDDRSAEDTDLGFVPLLSFAGEYRFSPTRSVFIDGDALAAPQGRAADVLAGVQFAARDNLQVRIGARVLEGGADVDDVYNFAAFIYGVIGLRLLL